MSTIAERTKLPQVLLIEDNPGDARLMKLAFKNSDMPSFVTVAASAEIGLGILRREQAFLDSRYPDIILIDLNLPHMRASEFLALVKADPHLRMIPVIVLSSSNAEEDLAATYANYVNGFVIKPFSLDDYADVVKNIEDYWFKYVETLPAHFADPDNRVSDSVGESSDLHLRN
jgi:CheY-like chemotaxis protein